MHCSPIPPIRAALVGDHPALLALWEESVRGSHHFMAARDIDFYLSHVPRALALLDLRLIASTSKDAAPVGFVGYRTSRIEMLFIASRWQGRGMAQHLLAALIADHPQINWTVDVNEQNLRARHFYALQGFEPVGRSALDHGGRPYPLLHLRRSALREADGKAL